jgi:hypothetical protein
MTPMLAQEVTSFSEAFQKMDILTKPERLLEMLTGLPLVASCMIVVVGALCVFNGYRWHKWVVVVLAFMAGLGIGHVLSQRMGKSVVVAIAVGVLCATVATPMLRWTVALFGGLTGAFLGAHAWTLANASPADAQWAGASMGFIAMALLSCVVFRLVVVAFTSIGGAAMVVLGSIALMLHVPTWQEGLREGLTRNQTLIPLLVTVAAVAGFVIQESRNRGNNAEAEKS